MKDERDEKGKMGKDVAGARGVLWAEVAKVAGTESLGERTARRR